MEGRSLSSAAGGGQGSASGELDAERVGSNGSYASGESGGSGGVRGPRPSGFKHNSNFKSSFKLG